MKAIVVPRRSGEEENMDEQPIATRPLNDNEKLLRIKFYESIAGQSDLLDKLGERLLTLELAIPGLYAAVLKLVRGDEAVVVLNTAFYLTFGCWLLALVLTLFALTPKNWKVDPAVLRQDPGKYEEALGIQDFFEKSAQYKRRLLVASSILFFAGTFSAAFTI
jgi:hypothetical protein